MRIRLLTVAVFAFAVSACGGGGRPSLPSEEEARKLALPAYDNGLTYEIHALDCNYADPPQSAKTGEWMAICTYEMTETGPAVAMRRDGDFRIFWKEITDQSGTSSRWVVGY